MSTVIIKPHYFGLRFKQVLGLLKNIKLYNTRRKELFIRPKDKTN